MRSKFQALPFYALLLSTFGCAAWEKIKGGTTPDWFLKQFTGSALDLFAGSLPMAFWFLALIEAVAFFTLLASLARREFLPRRARPLLAAGLLVSEFAFVALSFGQRITHQYEGAFQLFAMAVLTLIGGRLFLKDAES